MVVRGVRWHIGWLCGHNDVCVLVKDLNWQIDWLDGRGFGILGGNAQKVSRFQYTPHRYALAVDRQPVFQKFDMLDLFGGEAQIGLQKLTQKLAVLLFGDAVFHACASFSAVLIIVSHFCMNYKMIL